MKQIIHPTLLTVALAIQSSVSLFAGNTRDLSFDADWRFLRADAPGAEKPAFDDSKWRQLDVPHDWSIEDLPPLKTGTEGQTSSRVGPFDPDASENHHFTANTVGGIGWYRQHFTVSAAGKQVAVRFDGVYMNPEVWLNGHLLGEHPHGYTSFEFALTPYLNPPGQENVLAVRVRNEGKNSRWYSGSGIYRHVWLTVTGPVHVPTWGVVVTTPAISKDQALVKIASEVRNDGHSETEVLVRTRVLNAKGKVINTVEGRLPVPANETHSIEQSIEVPSPKLWSPDSPVLYSAEVEVIAAGKTADMVSTKFGIRKLAVDAEHGFRLNGEPLKLKGGCVHHDNGPLGAAAIDRAEERRVELLKANGFNAIRCAHNQPSPAFLDACDRLGMLVIDEVFDQWNLSKEHNDQDYHRFFKDWSSRDLAAMVRRDRNHPSIVMWSVGNEIPEQFRDEATGMRLRKEVLALDSTRPITQAVSGTKDWDKVSDPAFTHLDVAGYNYLPNHFEADHARHPDRVIVATETYPRDAFGGWSLVEKHPYVIGDFVWTAMDYLGESGLAHSLLSNQTNSFFMSWPWFDAGCGDLDICGFKKPQSFYRDVVWRRSPIAMAVHVPIPSGLTEVLSKWAWPDEAQSWNWPGQEGKPLQVAVYSRCETVRLELNGKVIGEKPVSDATKLTARFDVPYAPGELRAFALIQGKVVAQTTLKTSGPPKKLKLTVDRTRIRADRNDLAYVTVEVVDDSGQRVPNAAIPVRFSVSGTGELAAQASGTPNDPASFRAPVCKTFQGRCLAILRPTGGAGKMVLRAEAEGFEPETLNIRSRAILPTTP
jgi:beta-galactosidase